MDSRLKYIVTKRIAALSIALLFATFDSLVVPGIRVSVADISVVVFLFFLGIKRRAISKIGVNILLPFLAIAFYNSIVYLGYVIIYGDEFKYYLLISGFLRPMFFASLAGLLYYGLMHSEYSSVEIFKSISILCYLLFFVVFFQYIGYWPPQYYNNPAFGEMGKWTIFSEGWRPTGLTNEASFIGLFLVLLLSIQLHLTRTLNFLYFNIFYRLGHFVTISACFITTSRVALMFSLVVYALFTGARQLFFIAPVLLILILLFGVDQRFVNLLSFEGDASTIERYGSFSAYIEAILSGRFVFGTGYLNGTAAASSFLDPIVLATLDGRDLPAFSVPVQLVLELGVPGLVGIIYIIFSRLRKFFSLPFFALFLCAAVTGLQNFLFVYIFISVFAYVQNSRNK